MSNNANIPCLNKALCGVQSHRPGTDAACRRQSGGRGTAGAGTQSNLSSVPQRAGAGSGKIDLDFDEMQMDDTTDIAETVVDTYGVFVKDAHNEGLQFSDTGWEHTRWEISLQSGDETYPATHMMGKALGDRTPQPEEIIESWIYEARDYEQYDTAEDFVRGEDTGYDWDNEDDRKKVEEDWKVMGAQSGHLKAIVGENTYRSLIGPT